MTFGTPTTDLQPASVDERLAHIMCMQRRLECITRQNRGISFLGVFLATSLALWAYSVAREPRR